MLETDNGDKAEKAKEKVFQNFLARYQSDIEDRRARQAAQFHEYKRKTMTECTFSPRISHRRETVPARDDRDLNRQEPGQRKTKAGYPEASKQRFEPAARKTKAGSVEASRPSFGELMRRLQAAETSNHIGLSLHYRGLLQSEARLARQKKNEQSKMTECTFSPRIMHRGEFSPRTSRECTFSPRIGHSLSYRGLPQSQRLERQKKRPEEMEQAAAMVFADVMQQKKRLMHQDVEQAAAAVIAEIQEKKKRRDEVEQAAAVVMADIMATLDK